MLQRPQCRNTSRNAGWIGPLPRRRPLRATVDGDVLTTGPWTSPGVHYLTCPVHPEMNVKVIVRECAGTHCC